MIGQCNLQSRIEQLIENHTFPRFSIFVGPKGSGKKTLVHWIYQQFGTGILSNIGISVDAVRQSIVESYRLIGSPCIYLFADADNMSNAAKNALLKVTEEPPNNAYFIMTLEDENNTLETIRSRGTVFHMDRYTPDEIVEYAYVRHIPELRKDDIPIIKELCETPGDVDLMIKMGIEEFYDYVQLVVDNIADVSLANAFKIPSKVALKDTDEGYDLRLFWKTFIACCVSDRYVKNKRIVNAVSATSKYLQKLRVKGINRQMLIDCWLMEIRELWM